MAEKPFIPTYEWVSRKLEQRRTALNALTTAMEEDEDYRLMASKARGAAELYLSGLPPGFVFRYPSLAQDAIQVGVNRMVSGEVPEVHATFPDHSFDQYEKKDREAKEREARELVVRWVQAGCKHILAAQAENVAREMNGHALALGMGPIYYPISYRQWPDPPFGWGEVEDGEKKPLPPPKDTPENRDRMRLWERKRRRSYPWATSVPHPTWVFWDLGSDPPSDYILEELVSAATIVEDHPEYDDLKAGKTAAQTETPDLKRVTYISDDWAGQWCEGRPLFKSKAKGIPDGVARNLSGRPWVQMAFSGMGNKDVTASWEYRVKGSMRDGRDILLTMVKAWNWMLALGEQGAFPVPVAKGPGAEQALAELEYGAESPGVALDAQTSLSVFEPPKTPDQVYRLWEIAEARFSGHFGQPVLSGERSAGEPMGSLRSRAEMAGMPFESVKVSVEQAFGTMFEHKLEMIKYVLMEPVTVEGVTLRPKDIVEGTQIKIDLTPLTEGEKAFKRTAAQDDVKMGASTVADYIRTQVGNPDPDAVITAVRAERLAEAVLADPQIAALLVQKMAMDLQAKLGLQVEPGTEGPEEQGGLPPGSTEPLEMQPPPPSLGSAGEAQQYAEGVTNGAPVAVSRRGVQAGA